LRTVRPRKKGSPVRGTQTRTAPHERDTRKNCPRGKGEGSGQTPEQQTCIVPWELQKKKVVHRRGDRKGDHDPNQRFLLGSIEGKESSVGAYRAAHLEGPQRNETSSTNNLTPDGPHRSWTEGGRSTGERTRARGGACDEILSRTYQNSEAAESHGRRFINKHLFKGEEGRDYGCSHSLADELRTV